MNKFIAKAQSQLEITATALKTLQNKMTESKSIRVVQLTDQDRYAGPLFPVEVGFHCDACDKPFKTKGSGNLQWRRSQEPGVCSVVRHCRGPIHKKKHIRWIQKAKAVDVGDEKPPCKKVRRGTGDAAVAEAIADNKVRYYIHTHAGQF